MKKAFLAYWDSGSDLYENYFYENYCITLDEAKAKQIVEEQNDRFKRLRELKMEMLKIAEKTLSPRPQMNFSDMETPSKHRCSSKEEKRIYEKSYKKWQAEQEKLFEEMREWNRKEKIEFKRILLEDLGATEEEIKEIYSQADENVIFLDISKIFGYEALELK